MMYFNLKTARTRWGFANKAGFTAVELLVTLFVAGAFLIAGYQLFNIVIKDGGDARAQSSAANVAYSYLRQYSGSATNPCTSSSPVVNQPVTVSGLSDVTVTVTISCAQSDATSLSKIVSTVKYNKPQQTVSYATYVDRSDGASADTDVTDGLVGWWKFNGNGSKSAGVNDASLFSNGFTTNRDGINNAALTFNGSTSVASIANHSSYTPTSVSFSFWVNPVSWASATATSFISLRSTQNDGYIIAYLNANNAVFVDCSGSAQRWNTGYKPPFNTWTNLVVVCTPSSLAMYVNSGSATYGGATYTRATNNNTAIGSAANLYLGGDQSGGSLAYQLNGSMDDVRIYDRAISGSEAQQLYLGGPK